MYGPEADNYIISKVLQGDHRAYSELVERHQDFVFTIAMKYMQNREDTEEIAQDVFVKAYRSLRDFGSQSKFSTWLFAITRNSCLTLLRTKKKKTVSLDDERIYVSAGNTGADYVTEHIMQRSQSAMIKESIKLLDPEDALVLTLFYKSGQSLEEIGQIMGLTPNNVKVKLHRARKKLKTKMEIYYKAELGSIKNT